MKGKAGSKKLSKKVGQFSKGGSFIKEWSSTREAEKYGYNHSSISLCCSGKLKTHSKYIWKYI